MTATETISTRMTASEPATVRKSAVKHARHRRRDWRGAARAFRKLMIDKEDTAQVFAITHALDGDACKVDYIRLLSMPEGGRIAYERVELADKLMDDAYRASFPPGRSGRRSSRWRCAVDLRCFFWTSRRSVSTFRRALSCGRRCGS